MVLLKLNVQMTNVRMEEFVLILLEVLIVLLLMNQVSGEELTLMNMFHIVLITHV